MDLVLEAAKRAGADAIHPGYGFLSENAEFARAVEAPGLTWVGPTPESIEAMGSKIEAKRIMREAGVPVLDVPRAGRTEADLPLIVKASAGAAAAACGSSATSPTWRRDRAALGRGGLGLRRRHRLRRAVRRAAAATSRCRSSATGAGDVLVLGERDCSIQRRHQKVVEEAPGTRSPRRRARRAARGGARPRRRRSTTSAPARSSSSTTPATERFFFLEMNTRLQVEHPVTELVYGVDLVALQLAVAEGAARA